jgi:hypothetical protein
MNKRLKQALVAPVIAIAVLATMGFTRESSLSLEAYVPVSCSVGFSFSPTAFDGEGRANLGRTSETCNSGSGYRLYARATGDVDGTSLIVDGRSVNLAPGREVLLVDEVGAGSIARKIDYLSETLSDGGSLQLRIEAK